MNEILYDDKLSQRQTECEVFMFCVFPCSPVLENEGGVVIQHGTSLSGRKSFKSAGMSRADSAGHGLYRYNRTRYISS